MNNGAFCLSSTYIYGELPGESANEMSLWETSELGDLKTLKISCIGHVEEGVKMKMPKSLKSFNWIKAESGGVGMGKEGVQRMLTPEERSLGVLRGGQYLQTKWCLS